MNKIKCNKCNYEWFYKGDKLMVTCPSCLSKTLNKNKEVVK